MKRREVLKSVGLGAIAATGGLAAPSIARAAGNSVLRFVPQANLANLDPIWTTLYVVRNASILFYDTLYGIDSDFVPRPQMCEGSDVSADALTWTFKLRPGLKFHDNEKVRGADVVASLKRWMVRDVMGQMISARLNEMSTPDDRTVVLKLKSPYPKMLYALGRTSTPMCFIMPERIAKTDPFKQIGEYVGSGPFKFKRDEWVPGSSAVFEKFADYVPREEKASWAAGGKKVNFDRVEWKIIPDAATAAAALQNNEVDWWESPISDIVPTLKRNKDLRVDIADPLGNIGDCRFNHLYPPFNDVRVRRAVMMAANQADYMQALVGDDRQLWQESPSYFTPGTPEYTTAGGDVLKRKNIEAAKKLIAEAGATGARVVMLVGTDVPIVKTQGDVTADLLTKIGLKVDYVATDWGTVGARRASREPVEKGGWNIFFTWHAGADCANPAAQPAYYTTGEKAWFGWPKSEKVQQTIDDWFAAPDAAAEKAAMVKVNEAEMEFATFLPTGFFKGYQAWRNSVKGVVQAPFPVLWNVSKT